MADQEDIANQLVLLQSYRQTLAYLLRQQAIFGDAFTPPYILHSVRQAREHINHIKNTLKLWNTSVEDQISDKEITIPPFTSETHKSNQLVSLRGKIEVAQVSNATIPGASGVHYYILLEKGISIEPDEIALKMNPDIIVLRLDEIQVMINRVEYILKTVST